MEDTAAFDPEPWEDDTPEDPDPDPWGEDECFEAVIRALLPRAEIVRLGPR